MWRYLIWQGSSARKILKQRCNYLLVGCVTLPVASVDLCVACLRFLSKVSYKKLFQVCTDFCCIDIRKFSLNDEFEDTSLGNLFPFVWLLFTLCKLKPFLLLSISHVVNE